MGAITTYFYKKISDLEATIEELKNQIAMQNSQIRYLLGNNKNFQLTPLTTPLKIPETSKGLSRPQQNSQNQGLSRPQQNQICENGVCRLKAPSEKKVVISKISKQVEFDSEHTDLIQTSKVNTFTHRSPNPVLKSVTPKPSVSSVSDTDLDQILNDIDEE